MIHLHPLLHFETVRQAIPKNTAPIGLFLEIKKEMATIGVFQLQEFTKVCGIVHLHIFENYQNKGIVKQLYDPLIDWVRQNTRYSKLLATIPEDNIKMRAIVAKLPFRICGIVGDGIIYNNRSQNLLLFELNIG